MNIQPIVEGHGEVHAVPVLLRRLREHFQCYDVDVNRPIRQPRNQLVLKGGMARASKLARLQEKCGGILVLIDSDDDCPRTMAPDLQIAWDDASAGIPCRVVLAHREYEAWFLGAMPSLRGRHGIRDDAVEHENPEGPRDAKRELELRMRPGLSYQETTDQEKFSAIFDLESARKTCRSFRKLGKAFLELVRAMGGTIEASRLKSWGGLGL